MKRVRRFTAPAALAVAAPLLFAGLAMGGTLKGTVKNGTTGQPAAGVKVILIQLQGTMQPVASTVSGAQGQFSFDNPNLGAQPMLVRAVYKDVNFHEPAPPGQSDVQVEIFEPTTDPQSIKVTSRAVIFQPNGAKLTVGEEYFIENISQPPKAFFSTAGNFEFALPPGAELQQVAASGPTKMPVVQAPIDKSKNHYAIAYAFRPGQSTVRFSYELPYADNAAVVKLPPSPYPAGQVLVVAAPTVQISGEGWQPGGQQEGMNIYGRDNVAANTALTVNVAGTAPPASPSADAGPQGDGAPGSGADIVVVPGRFDGAKWYLLGALAVIFGVLAFLLSRKTIVTVPVNGAGEHVTTALPAAAKTRVRPAASGATAFAPQGSAVNAEAKIADVDAEIGTSLDSLKDRLFRLELRLQAGTISEEEYARERANAEKMLRELVRG